jgi:ABC-2 type transport system ATP-binding protein
VTGIGRAPDLLEPRPAVRARGLVHRFRSGRRGLAGVDLEVDGGEIIALAGPNGAGKSTLLRILARQLQPTAGTVEVASLGIGFAAEEDAHFDALNGLENALFFARANGLTAEAAAIAVDSLLRRFRLDGEAGAAAGAMSFGMRRKLTLVEALAHAPGLLLLDEPTIGLDSAAVEALRLLLSERAAAGAGIVFSSHRLDLAACLATRVVFLHDGRIVGGGAPAGLLDSLKGLTTIDIEIAGVAPDLAFPTGCVASGTAAGYRIESRHGTATLPGIVETLVASGVPIRAIRVIEPDLGEVFRRLVGVELREPADETSHAS